MTRLGGPCRLHGKQFGRQIPHRSLSLLLGLGPAGATDGAELRTRLARSDVLADQMGLGDRHVELGSLVVTGARGIFNHQAFLTAARGACLTRGQRLETPVDPDAVLKMNDIVPEIEVGEIDLERIAHRLRMMGLQTPRSGHLVAPVNFRVRNHHASGRFTEESARQGAGENFGNRRSFRIFEGPGWAGRQQFAPQFTKALKFTGIVAKNLEVVALPQPPLHLLKEGPPLLLGHLRRWQGRSDGTESVERFEAQLHRITPAFWGGILDPNPRGSRRLNPQLQCLPRFVEGIPLADLTGVVVGLESQRLRSAQHHQSIRAPMRIERGHRRSRCLGPRLGSQQTQLARRRNHTRFDGIESGLAMGIEFPQRFELIPKELKSDGPWPMEGPQIHDATTPRQLALVGHLGLRFVALRLEPFDEVERIDCFSPTNGPGPGIQIGRSERALLDGRHGGDHELAHPRCRARHPQGNEGLQAFTDDVRMGQARLLRQRLPSREELRALPVQPSRRVGVQLFLRLQGVRDGHDDPIGMKPVQHRHQPCLRGRRHPFQTHKPTCLDVLAQGHDSGRCQPALQDGVGYGIQARLP